MHVAFRKFSTSVVKQASLGKKGKGISVKKVDFFFSELSSFFFSLTDLWGSFCCFLHKLQFTVASCLQKVECINHSLLKTAQCSARKVLHFLSQQAQIFVAFERGVCLAMFFILMSIQFSWSAYITKPCTLPVN